MFTEFWPQFKFWAILPFEFQLIHCPHALKHVSEFKSRPTAQYAEKLAPGQLKLYLDCGTEDDFALHNGMQYLHDILLDRHIEHAYYIGPGKHDFVFLSAVLTAFVDDLFPGMKVKGAYQFRVTRNSELFVDEEELENLASALRCQRVSRSHQVWDQRSESNLAPR